MWRRTPLSLVARLTVGQASVPIIGDVQLDETIPRELLERAAHEICSNLRRAFAVESHRHEGVKVLAYLRRYAQNQFLRRLLLLWSCHGALRGD